MAPDFSSIRRCCYVALAWGCLFFADCSGAVEPDPFSTQNRVAASAYGRMSLARENIAPCLFTQVPAPMGLLEAIDRALCLHPQTRLAWATAKGRADQLGLAQSTYLPTLNATVSDNRAHNRSEYQDMGVLDSDARTRSNNAGLSLNWVLFDSGLRRANVDMAQQALAAANAAHDASLQNVLFETAQLYYSAQARQASLNASLAAEKAAHDSQIVTEARYLAGAGSLADKLQAETALAQSVLTRGRAEGELQNALGALAGQIGLPVDSSISIEAPGEGLPGIEFAASLKALMDEARQQHPDLLLARAELDAAIARVDATKAEGRPSISLTGATTHTDLRGQLPADSVSRGHSIGLQLNIPIFEGFGRSYRIRQAESEVEGKSAELDSQVRKIELEVWKAYQALQTEGGNLQAVSRLLDNARLSFKISQGRYKGGVGNILELLNAQSAQANAEQQQIQVRSSWLIARLQLAASLGRLGVWAIK